MIFLWILVAIIIFSIVVLVHEWGHFAAARRFWVRVEEFWLGIPPRAKKLFTDKRWTLYSLNWLPLGWFVKLTWENPHTFLVYDENKKLYNNEKLEKDIKAKKDIFYKSWEKIWKQEKEEILKLLEENDAKYNLANKSSIEQAIIILAWIFMNFVLAFFIFFVLFLIWIKPIWINDKIETNLKLKIIPTREQAIESGLIIKNPWVILYPIAWSVAEKSNLKEWDKLYQVYTCKSKMLDYVNCEWWELAEVEEINKPDDIIKIITKNAWKDIAFYINAWFLSDEEKKVFWDDGMVWWSFVKVSVPIEWKIWSYLWENIEINNDYLIKYNISDSAKYAFIETKNQILLTFKWIWILVKKIFNPETPVERKEAIESLSWPIWIVDFINDSLSAWFIFMVIIWAIISINLWVFNLLPIPALDWWRFLFITINSIMKRIFGKKIISEKTEAILHFWFFVLLIALSLIIAYNDLNKIFAN